ncbi:flagellar assembly protein FliW [Spirochaetia bacterium 38H-sp]|uniref:Flagellar assembly factor FliW n=1 Tax=Rarispira pelagica TaxID=3141764 RepID=A0ABU9UD18_9SPIR
MATRRIETKTNGTIEIDERQILRFTAPILGFDNLTEYALLDYSRPPFYLLQSLEDSQIAFLLIDPCLFRPDYQPAPSRTDLEALGIQDPQELITLAIVTVPADHKQMTANLQGPILINKRTQEARQIISTDERWRTKHKILEEMAAARGA